MDRKNTVRHLIQMMAIHEEDHLGVGGVGGVGGSVGGVGGLQVQQRAGIPIEFQELYKDEELTQTLIDLIKTADDLDILDFQEFCKHIGKPKPMWSKTQATTGKHVPVY